MGPVISIQKGFIVNLKVDDKVWKNNSSLRDSGLIKVEVNPLTQEITVGSKVITKSKLKSDYGITFDKAIGKTICSFNISYKLKPIGIEQGGTGGSDTTTSLFNLGITGIQTYLNMLVENGNIPSVESLQADLNLNPYPNASGPAGTAVFVSATGVKLTGVVMGHACSSEARSNYGAAGD